MRERERERERKREREREKERERERERELMNLQDLSTTYIAVIKFYSTCAEMQSIFQATREKLSSAKTARRFYFQVLFFFFFFSFFILGPARRSLQFQSKPVADFFFKCRIRRGDRSVSWRDWIGSSSFPESLWLVMVLVEFVLL